MPLRTAARSAPQRTHPSHLGLLKSNFLHSTRAFRCDERIVSFDIAYYTKFSPAPVRHFHGDFVIMTQSHTQTIHFQPCKRPHPLSRRKKANRRSNVIVFDAANHGRTTSPLPLKDVATAIAQIGINSFTFTFATDVVSGGSRAP